ncbi:ATP-grasp domain-containing protein [Microcoleus sp. FACHB-831]|uniref:ATP-grasp domain-containing protein n=1 Tax=Microcoleus sp. FACHB-831 TaxID=2692827 RepID=UPI0016882DBD|nr:ATP-grasp domain-containing protein [Microcoleus sp. FACHB-831]MBD1923831.1 ATP-grasp domain-containing protein [Microcoleus sp. FACHB-831]
MKTLGICSSDSDQIYLESPNSVNYETISLYKEAKKVYDDVLVFNPSQISYKFVRELEKPKIILDNKDITSLTTLIVRRIVGSEQSTAILVNSLAACNCDVIDPLARFTGKVNSKLLPALRHHKKKIGINSYPAFNIENATQLINELAESDKFPLIVKPFNGRGGIGVELLNDRYTALEYAKNFFIQNAGNNVPILLQEFVRFKSEYRVMVIDGKCLGAVEKKAKPGSLAANAAQGGSFVVANVPNIVDFTVKNVSQKGIYGIDVGEDCDGKLYIIEANPTPMWSAFEQATGINVAKEIINCAIDRLHKKVNSPLLGATEVTP